MWPAKPVLFEIHAPQTITNKVAVEKGSKFKYNQEEIIYVFGQN